MLQPVLTTAVFTVIFSRFAKFDTGEIPYPLFALSGLMIWLFVHNSITMAGNSFISNTNLVTKVYFPRLIMPVAATFAGFADLVFSLAILIILMIWYAVVPGLAMIATILFLALAVILAIAVGTFFAALNVRFRDVKFALPFLLQVWMITSPVFYPAGLLSEKWKLVFAINPLVGILDGFRSALLNTPFDWPVIGISCLSIFIICIVALITFRGMEDGFADHI